MEALGKCMICGAKVTASFDICRVCEHEHSLTGPKADWPTWAKTMYAEHRAEQRREAEILSHEADNHFDPDEDTDEWLQDVSQARLMAGGVPSTSDMLLDALGVLSEDELAIKLPAAPYGDKATDRLYREANCVDSRNAIDYEPRSQKPLRIDHSEVFVHAEHVPATLEGFSLVEMDWFARERKAADGRIIPARYERRQVWRRVMK